VIEYFKEPLPISIVNIALWFAVIETSNYQVWQPKSTDAVLITGRENKEDNYMHEKIFVKIEQSKNNSIL